MDSKLYSLEQLRHLYPDADNTLSHTLETLFASARQIEIPAGTHILRESESCQNFMWLLGGEIRVYKNSDVGREITLYRVTPGDLCVLSLHCLLQKEGFPADAVTESEVIGLTLGWQDFDRAIKDSNEFCLYLLKDLSGRVSKVMGLISEVTFQQLELRLACLLGRLFERSNGTSITKTHVQLANELGTTREVVSRILKRLELQNCIRLSRGEIHLASREQLDWRTRV